jgi:hypothetical protein
LRPTALYLAQAEALLCKGGSALTPSLRDEYEAARARVAASFVRLGMPRKLQRLDQLELRAGIVRSPAS